MRIELHPEAEAELFGATTWYDDRRVGLGNDFLAAVDRWLEVLGESPHTWPLWPGAPEMLPPIRRVLLERFPYAVAYRAYQDRIAVLAVAHTSRKPLYWLARADG